MTLTNIAVVLSADEKYSLGLGVTIASFLRFINSEYLISIFVIDGGISKHNKERIERIVDNSKVNALIKFVKPDISSLQGLPCHSHFSLAAYYRLLIPILVDLSFEKVIYLDSDLLIRNDICQLWEIDIQDFALLACQDLSVRCEEPIENDFLAKGSYLNSGLLVFNLKKWRQENLSSQIIEYILKNSSSNVYADQDGINGVLTNDWKPLDLRWNVVTVLGEGEIFHTIPSSYLKKYLIIHKKRLLNEANIYHFVGRKKPWEIGCGMIGQLEWLDIMASCKWFSVDEFLKASFLFLMLKYDYFQRRIFRAFKNLLID